MKVPDSKSGLTFFSHVVEREKISFENETISQFGFVIQIFYFLKILGGVYSSPQEYFDTFQKLWTGMTFGDGNAALSPKCRVKKPNNGNDCGEVRNCRNIIRVPKGGQQNGT